MLGYGGTSGLHDNSFIVESNGLFICVDNDVMCLNIPELNLNWREKIDDATCFEIFKYSDDFIIHGELSIARISFTGKIKWSFYGPDIFSEEFKISDNRIYATDFNHDLFVLDIQTGKELKRQ